MTRLRSIAGFVVLLSWSTIAVADQPAIVTSKFVFETAPFASCHASTIAETKNGLVAAWFGGTHEGHADVGIWVARRVDGKWTAPVEVANGVQYRKADGTEHRHPTWNPVLFQPRDGPLMLFYKIGPSPQAWWGMLTTSADCGATWSPPRRLPEHIDGPVRNRPVQLPSGDILCPSSTEHHGWRVHFERTSDLGMTWTRTGSINDGKTIAAIQPSILVLGGDKLQALGRTQQGRIFQATSNDAGKTWGAMTLTELPNPDSGIDAVTLKDGRHLLAYNHTARGRSPLNLAISNDAKKWQAALALEREPGEYSYPSILQTSDGLVHLTYTWNRRRIKHVVVDPVRLSPRDFVDGAWPKAKLDAAPEGQTSGDASPQPKRAEANWKDWTIQIRTPIPNTAGFAIGTGFVVSKNGYVISNRHVIEVKGDRKAIFADGMAYSLRLVAAPKQLDLALLKIDANREFAPIRLVRSDSVMVGQAVAAPGNPGGAGLKLSRGAVTGIGTGWIWGGPYSDRMIRFDAPIQGGNSGGPLVDANGDGIGVIFCIAEGAPNAGFAVPMDGTLEFLRKTLDEQGAFPFALGIDVPAFGAASVAKVAPDSPAQKAGVKVGDRILHCNDSTIRQGFDFHLELVGKTAGEAIRLKLLRDRITLDLSVELGKRRPETHPDRNCSER